MSVSIKVPSPGESISEVEIAQWLVASGEYVFKDQDIVEVDSDKATLAIPAEVSGIIEIIAQSGETVAVGSEICRIDTSAPAPENTRSAPVKESAPKVNVQAEPVAAKLPIPAEAASPLAAKMMESHNLAPNAIVGSGARGKITKADVIQALSAGFPAASSASAGWGGSRETERKKMSMLRRKVAERLVSVKNETAMLTTFNEVDMSPILELRNKYKDAFAKKHGVNLGFMSLFTRAVTEALNLFPAVNAMIDGEEIIYHSYADIGIAVSTPKGLMVPVIRNAETMSLAQIESAIKDVAVRARDGKLSIDEMSGGTFTITNGGVFGSLLSTPIINPPQVAILGMHKIQERPVAINGQVVIRPMMYLALSYDHRIIDGKESVSFLVKIKEMLEQPERIIFGGKEPSEILLDL
jgi:2-oxoglutarate dehydrogenase E2 component (dihydrolipoamide succinyltransferase)